VLNEILFLLSLASGWREIEGRRVLASLLAPGGRAAFLAVALPLRRGAPPGFQLPPGCPTQALVPLSPRQRASCFADIWFWLLSPLLAFTAPPPSIKPVPSIEFPLWEILSGFIILLTL